jgi:hypothetical protein
MIKQLLLITTILVSSLYCAQSTEIDDLGDALSSLFVSKPIYHLCRSSEVLHYADTVDGVDLVDDSSDKKLQAVSQFAANDRYKCHVLVAPFFTTVDEFKQLPLFSTKHNFPGFTSNADKPLPLDWASGASSTALSNVCKKCSTEGNKHSEPQLVQDLNDKMIQDSAAVVRLYNTEDDEIVGQCGIRLYSSFDMCDECMQTLFSFQANAATQTGIISALQDKLKDRAPQLTKFSIIYQSMWPYKASSQSMPQAVYSVKREGQVLQASCDYSFSNGKRKDIFTITNQANIMGMLRPHNRFTRLDSNFIHANVRQLAGKEVESTSNTFEFS